MKTGSAARLRNRADRSEYRAAEKRVLAAQTKAVGEVELRKAFELFDRLASKGVVHRNTASRHKARLSRHVSSLTS